jgi:hypothetical protein
MSEIYSVGINGLVSKIPKKVSPLVLFNFFIGHMPNPCQAEGEAEERAGDQGFAVLNLRVWV